MQKNALQYMIEPYCKPVEFSGRARRMEYWMFNLLNFIVLTVTATIPTLFAIFAFLNFLPYLAVNIRRLHDINKSGWLILFFLLVYVAAAYFTYYNGLWSAIFAMFSEDGIDWVGTLMNSLIILFSIWGVVFGAYIILMCLPGTKGKNQYGNDPISAKERKKV